MHLRGVLWTTVAYFTSVAALSFETYSAICTESTVNDSVHVVNPISGRDTTTTCKVYAGTVPGALAWVRYADTTNTTGWADLRVTLAPASGKDRLDRG